MVMTEYAGSTRNIRLKLSTYTWHLKRQLSFFCVSWACISRTRNTFSISATQASVPLPTFWEKLLPHAKFHGNRTISCWVISKKMILGKCYYVTFDLCCRKSVCLSSVCLSSLTLYPEGCTFWHFLHHLIA